MTVASHAPASDDLPTKLTAIRRRMNDAAQAAGRNPAGIDLIAVSKTHSQEAVLQALAAGQKIFGENRVQEAEKKFVGLKDRHNDLRLHLIGPLQTNKAVDAVRLFDVIQTLDRPKLAEALATAIQKTGRKPVCYIEINIGAEPQKSGIAPQELQGFVELCRQKHGLTVSGLMCIPPQDQAPEPFFHALHDLAQTYHLPHISMGMSGDFESAIRCGATEVRVGTALFGSRAL